MQVKYLAMIIINKIPARSVRKNNLLEINPHMLLIACSPIIHISY